MTESNNRQSLLERLRARRQVLLDRNPSPRSRVALEAVDQNDFHDLARAIYMFGDGGFYASVLHHQLNLPIVIVARVQNSLCLEPELAFDQRGNEVDVSAHHLVCWGGDDYEDFVGRHSLADLQKSYADDSGRAVRIFQDSYGLGSLRHSPNDDYRLALEVFEHILGSSSDSGAEGELHYRCQ